ncbi:hypothetical protein P872_07635 [Rhodonellum psychrophilum GCM71 = DSM 17998]|uniref:Uncharacterized protein n=2 Tax=Rhodonellum TaxID=336827 RepID=U5BVX6_9BACT|nr:hypothetical protein P872_07635 [Rhodonellum psychrophilum GCM71 = DSM 17998]SDZ32264.1 hypothetical protein SAMN05444412_11066 [Rhodonellum ikkaensis]
MVVELFLIWLQIKLKAYGNYFRIASISIMKKNTDEKIVIDPFLLQLN